MDAEIDNGDADMVRENLIDFTAVHYYSPYSLARVQIAHDLMDEVVSLASDYIGNTIVQKVSKRRHCLDLVPS